MCVFKRRLCWGYPTAWLLLQTILSQGLDDTTRYLVRGYVIVLLTCHEIAIGVRHCLARRQEILLCCLCHHKAHATYPSICISLLALNGPVVLIDYAGLHDSWVRIRWLPPEHTSVVHSIWNQSNILLDIIWIWLYTLVPLILLV